MEKLPLTNEASHGISGTSQPVETRAMKENNYRIIRSDDESYQARLFRV